jgi:hypothetical protein
MAAASKGGIAMELVRRRHTGAARGVASAVCLVLLATTPGIPAAWAQQQATITGVILGPDEKPQAGCQIVLREIGPGTEYRTARTGPDGVYSIDVPVGPRYAFVSVIDPAGGVHPLSLTPLAVTVAAKMTRNIRIVPAGDAPTASTPAASPTAPATAAAPAAAKDEEEKKKPATWWSRNGKWVGIGVGAVAIIALAGGGDSDSPASPSSP